MSAPRFEVVTAARDKHWARYVAANGRNVWTTETYTRRKAAENAVCVITGQFIQHDDTGPHVWDHQHGRVEVRYVDRLVPVERPELPTQGAVE